MTGASAPAWPIVERPAAATAVRAGLAERPPRLQLIAGDPGAGKSALAETVAASLGGTVVHVIALADRAATPLAAFADVVPADGSGDAPDPAGLVAALARGAAQTVLVVDDAPRLDPASADVVARLVRGVGLRVIATARDGEALPAALAALDAERLVRRHRLDGLTARETARLLESRFRVPVRDEDVRRLVAETAGNPLHLRLLVEEAIDAGHVLHRGDAVEFTRPDTPAGLRAALAARVAALDDDARRALAVVALAEPVAPDSFLVPHGRREVLGELIRRGMVATEPATSRLRIAHPLVAEALGDPDRAPAIDEALRLLRDGEPSRRFRAIQLEQRTGRRSTVDDLVWAAGCASAVGDDRAAVELADAAVRQPASRERAFAASVAAARAHSRLDALDEADRLFAAALPLAESPAERAALASAYGDHLAFGRHDPGAAIAHGERVRAGLTPQASVALDADLWRWRVLSEHGAAAEPEVRRAIAATVAACMRAEPDAALVAARPLLSGAPLPAGLAATAAIPLGLQRVVALRSAGRSSEAESYLESARAAAGEESGFFSLLLAVQRAHGGRLDAAVRDAALAVEQLTRWDGGELLPLALAARATVAALRGDLDAARAESSVLHGMELSGAAVLQRAECDAILDFREDRLEDAVGTILDVVEDAIRSEYRYLGALALATAIRFGEVARAAELAERICAGMSEASEVCLAVRDLAAALRDGRPDAALAAAERTAAAGLVAVAIDAITLALRLPGGDPTRRRLHALAAALSRDVDAEPLQPRAVPALTPRELEVATAAAGRMRSREIAALVGVSIRTVEHQLASAYRKLGVASRDELRHALLDVGLLVADDADVRGDITTSRA